MWWSAHRWRYCKGLRRFGAAREFRSVTERSGCCSYRYGVQIQRSEAVHRHSTHLVKDAVHDQEESPAPVNRSARHPADDHADVTDITAPRPGHGDPSACEREPSCNQPLARFIHSAGSRYHERDQRRGTAGGHGGGHGLWEPAARLLLQGATWDGIGEELFGRGIRGPRGGVLGHSAIRNFLTRPELVGKIDVVDRTVDPHVVERIDAKWDAMVDVELFRSVQEEVERRASDSRNQQRRERGTFILRPVCGSCGGEFHGSRSAKVAGDGRAFVHRRPTIRDGELFDRFKGAGCMQYNVVADELECAIRDLILEERGSDSYEEEMRELLGARERFRGVADEAPASARSNVEDLQRKRSRVLSNSLELDLSSEEGDVARRPT
jgi:hypothetical protein